MTTRPDPDIAIAAWLREEAPDRAPERLLTASRDRIRTTNQDRAWWPVWRTRPMFTPTRLAGAVGAVAVLALVGIALFPTVGGIGGTRPSVAPSPTPTPTATPTPTPGPSLTILRPGTLCPLGPQPSCDVGALTAGTYTFLAGGVTPTQLRFTVPAGWTITDSGFVNKGVDDQRATFVTWDVTHIFTDICHWTGANVPAGSTAGDIATALSAQKGRTASAVTDVTVGGYPAKRVALTLPAEADIAGCSGPKFRLWPDTGGSESGGLLAGLPGSIDVTYVVDGPDKPFVVVARQQPNSSAADRAELQAIVDSVVIDPPPASPAPSASARSTASPGP
jgi:hypothetical protein